VGRRKKPGRERKTGPSCWDEGEKETMMNAGEMNIMEKNPDDYAGIFRFEGEDEGEPAWIV
jgi:hypothetical protein